MAIKREKYRDGVFVGEMVSTYDKPSPEELQEVFDEIMPGTEEVILDIRKTIGKILTDKTSSKVMVDNAQEALFHLDLIVDNVRNGSREDVFINTYHMMINLWKAKIRPFERHIFHFEKEHANFGKKAVFPRRDNVDHRDWREEAARIQLERSNKGWKPLASRPLAKTVKQNLKLIGKGTSIERIRHIIA